MKKLTFSALPALLLLAACGGGSSTVANFSTLKVFGDQAGVASGVAVDGSKRLIISPAIAEAVAAANQTTQSQADALQYSNFPVVQVLSTNANLRSGTVVSDGITFNVTAVEDLGGEAGLVLAEVPNVANMVMAIGSEMGTAPVGNFVYTGTMGFGRRSIGSTPELGSFTMGADFLDGTVYFAGSTASNSVSGSGVLNAVTGDFASNNLAVTTSGYSRTGTMYGQMHGANAESTSGVIHTNESTPTYAGAFVGSR